MNEMPPVISPPPKRTGWVVYSVIVTFLLFVSLLANLVLFVFAFGRGGRDSGLGLHAPRFEEQFISGETDTRNKIAVIYLTGMITSADEGDSSEDGMVGDIKDQLRQALDDHNVKAIILRINSPGGEVVASDAIYQAVSDAREQKRIVASIDALGASGAYYAAVGADYIIANELSLTGSIGVIMQSFSLGGYEGSLMNKIGVKAYTFKSGRYKDVLNPTREPTEDEKQLIQSMIMEVYDKFVEIVAREREMNVDELKSGLADGRVLTGKQAKDAHFIDDTGYFEDAIDRAKELGHVKKAKVIRYLRPFSLRQLFRILGKSDQRPQVRIELGAQALKLQTGKIYYLPAFLFQ